MRLFHEACGSSQLRVRTSGFSWLSSFHPAAAFPARPGAGARFPARRHINRSAAAESQDKSPRLFCVVCDKPPRAYRKPFFRPGRGKKPGQKTRRKTRPRKKPGPGTLSDFALRKSAAGHTFGLCAAKVRAGHTLPLRFGKVHLPTGQKDFSRRKSAAGHTFGLCPAKVRRAAGPFAVCSAGLGPRGISIPGCACGGPRPPHAQNSDKLGPGGISAKIHLVSFFQ